MCGFVGSLGAGFTPAEIARALATIQHRGPDGSQVIEEGPLCLGACRLAIVPPLDALPVFRSGEQVVVLNGEVYGLEPSREDDAVWMHLTDTGRLARHLARSGMDLLPRLRGLFAFCMFDLGRLQLVRDRFGIKPLYYSRAGGGLVFASEMKAILALPGISRDLDVDVLSACATVGFNVFAGRTPFRALRAVRPGHLLRFGPEGSLEERSFVPASTTYLTAPTRSPGRGIETRVETLLDASVRRAMLHDPQPKALFLSGGLDSTLLLDLARGYGSIEAYVLSDRAEADDLLEARRVAAALHVPLNEQLVDANELAREVVHYAWHFERPIAGGAYDLLGGVAFHALSRAIARHGRVAISGEGADELFLGYHRLHMEPCLTAATIRSRARDHATPTVMEWIEASLPDRGVSEALRNLALRQGLSEYHLPSVDHSGMAFGLEIRPPYLDNDLVEFATQLDETELLDRIGNWTKIPLRAIARRRLAGHGLDRVSIRRKRAMSSAVVVAGRYLTAQVAAAWGRTGEDPMDLVLRALFEYLHVDPGLNAPPDFSLVEFAREVAGRRQVR